MIVRYCLNEEITIKDFFKKINFSKKLLIFIKNNGGKFIVNGIEVKNYYLLHKEDILDILIPDDTINHELISQDIGLNVVYEDEYLLIVNKNCNLLTIPNRLEYTNSLANAVKYYYEKNGIKSNIHFVNRLDKDTSGLILLVKNRYLHFIMGNTLITKKYIAKVHGKLRENNGIIDLPILKIEENMKRIIDPAGKKSITKFRVLREIDENSILELDLITGRTHQIRLHLSSINHPIINDKLYGFSCDGDLFLHSYYLKFIHPVTNKELEIMNYPIWYS